MYKSLMHNYAFCGSAVACSLLFLAIGSGFYAHSQTPASNLSFEVASVKPVSPTSHFDPKHYYAHVHPASASYWSMTPKMLISYAYGVELFQVSGPTWTDVESFDIEARFPEGAGSNDDRRMLQALLGERFGLTYHTEERQLEGYVLVVGKHGERLKPSLQHAIPPKTDDPLKQGESNNGGDPTTPGPAINKDGSSTLDMGERGTQTLRFDREKQSIHFEISKLTMEELAGKLENCLGSGIHKVEDQTGLKGTYQVAFDCPNPALPTLSTDADHAPLSDPQGSYYLAQSLDALGLKLGKRKFPQKVYVIDHIERPSAN